MATAQLHHRLRSVRRRLLAIGSTSAVVWGLIAAVGLLLVGAWLDLLWELSPRLRIASLVCAASVAAMLICLLVRNIIVTGRDRAIARRLDRVAGSGGDILTGLELDEPVALQSGAMLTTGLARLAADHAAVVANRVSPAQAVPRKPLGRSLGVLMCSLVIVGLLAVCLPGLARTEWNRFANPFGDVPPFSRTHFEVTPGDVEVLYGGELEIRVTVTGPPVDQVELVLKNADRPDDEIDGEILPMFSESSGHWRAFLAKVTEPAVYHVRAYRARSEKYRIRVITVPRIENVRVRVTPPAYTNQSAYEGPLPKEGVAGLPGTEVRIWATSNRPLSGGTIVVTGPQQPLDVSRRSADQRSMKPAGPESREVVGRFEIASDGQFSVDVTDINGQSSQQPFSGSITLLADERPFIRLARPRKTSLATPHVDLPVEISAEDDYGVSRVQLFRSLNDSRPLPVEVSSEVRRPEVEEQPPPRRVRSQLYLPLHKYGLEPGDVIKLFARVEDNDPAGAKGSESAVVTVHIISQQEFERMVSIRKGLETLLSKYREAQRRVENLNKEIEELLEKLKDAPPDSQIAQETREELQRVLKQLRKESEALRRLASHRLPFDLDENLTPQIEKLAQMSAEITEEIEKLAAEDELLNKQLAEALKQIAKKLGAGRRSYDEKAMAPMEHLAAAFPLMADQARFVALVLRQEDLAQRLSTLKGRDGEDNPALKNRMRELEQEQRQIREALETLLDDIENHVTKLPEGEAFDMLRETATEFAEAVRASDASLAMAMAEGGLAEFSGTLGYEQAQRAADTLNKFLKKCEGLGGSGQACLAFQPTLGKCLGNTISQLLAQMGLSMGGGMGPGMGGYSAMRGNFGLYGGMPGMAGGDFGEYAGEGSDANADSSGDGFGQRGGRNPDANTYVRPPAAAEATGIGEGVVPVRYRRRVGEYFQRITEELGER